MKTMEIYYNDLNEETKRRYLKFEDVEDAGELNHEISALAILEREEETELTREAIEAQELIEQLTKTVKQQRARNDALIKAWKSVRPIAYRGAISIKECVTYAAAAETFAKAKEK